MGATLDEAQIAMKTIGSTAESQTHPAKHNRLAAIANGWTKACEDNPRCGSSDNRRDKNSEDNDRDEERHFEEEKERDFEEQRRQDELRKKLILAATKTMECS